MSEKPVASTFAARLADIEKACEVMHVAYERAAVGAGWDTNPASRVEWADVPEANKVTMRAAVGALLEWLGTEAILALVEAATSTEVEE